MLRSQCERLGRGGARISGGGGGAGGRVYPGGRARRRRVARPVAQLSVGLEVFHDCEDHTGRSALPTIGSCHRTIPGTIAPMRIGQGIDVHAFAAGRRLVLGGVAIPHPRGLAGHSDADALTHAVIDAMLGAAALGDIGGMFPSSDDRWRDARSIDLLRLSYERLRGAGWRVANVDATVVAEEPRLAPHVPAMREAIAEALELDIGAVSVKATTTDGLGFTGRGDGVAALAVVLLE